MGNIFLDEHLFMKRASQSVLGFQAFPGSVYNFFEDLP